MELTTDPTAFADSPSLTALKGLHHDRAGLTSEFARLTAILTRLRTEAAAGESLINDLAQIGKAEVDAMRAWADGGCKGAAPTGKETERQALARKIAIANATSAAARGAMADIELQIRQSSEKLAKVNQAIGDAAFNVMQADFADVQAQHLIATQSVRHLSAKLLGLSSYLANEGRRLLDNGDETGRPFLVRAEALSATKLPNPGVTHPEIIEAANDWSRRAAALRAGSAA